MVAITPTCLAAVVVLSYVVVPSYVHAAIVPHRHMDIPHKQIFPGRDPFPNVLARPATAREIRMRTQAQVRKDGAYSKVPKGVRLNISQRGKFDSRAARWKVRDDHPYSKINPKDLPSHLAMNIEQDAPGDRIDDLDFSDEYYAQYYLQKKDAHSRAIIVPNDSSNPYIVSQLSRTVLHPSSRGIVHPRDTQKREDLDRIPGNVELNANTNPDRSIASLHLDTSMLPFTFNANAKSATMLYLSAVPDSSIQDSDDVAVHLEVIFNDISNPRPVWYCVTYDHNPSKPEPMIVEPCSSTLRSHKSQTFAYDRITGILRPLRFLSRDSYTSVVPVDESSQINSRAYLPSQDDMSVTLVYYQRLGRL